MAVCCVAKDKEVGARVVQETCDNMTRPQFVECSFQFILSVWPHNLCVDIDFPACQVHNCTKLCNQMERKKTGASVIVPANICTQIAIEKTQITTN